MFNTGSDKTLGVKYMLSVAINFLFLSSLKHNLAVENVVCESPAVKTIYR
jgi:hypothetical protein